MMHPFLFRLWFLLPGWMLWLGACSSPKAQSKDARFYDPIAYNDYIIQHQNRVIWKLLEISDAIDSGAVQQVQHSFDSLLLIASQSLEAIESLSGYDGDSLLRNTALQLFRYYRRTFAGDYKRMIEIYLKQAGVSEEELKEFSMLHRRIQHDEDSLDELFRKAQMAFAQKYEFTFEE